MDLAALGERLGADGGVAGRRGEFPERYAGQMQATHRAMELRSGHFRAGEHSASRSDADGCARHLDLGQRHRTRRPRPTILQRPVRSTTETTAARLGRSAMVLLRQTSRAWSNWQLHRNYDPATIVICDRALRRAAKCTIRGSDVRG